MSLCNHRFENEMLFSFHMSVCGQRFDASYKDVFSFFVLALVRTRVHSCFPSKSKQTHTSGTTVTNTGPTTGTFHFPPSTCHLPPSTFHLPPYTCHLPSSTLHLTPSTFYLPLSTFHRPPSPWICACNRHSLSTHLVLIPAA